MATGEVIVDHPHRLHEGVAGGRADEAEPAGLERACHRGGLVRDGGDSVKVRGAGPGLRGEGPQEIAEGLTLRVKGRERAGVGDGRLDLGPVADDAGVGEQSRDVDVVEGGDALGVEAREGSPESLPLAQDRQPGQA
jgi:hypothetical protein